VTVLARDDVEVHYFQCNFDCDYFAVNFIAIETRKGVLLSEICLKINRSQEHKQTGLLRAVTDIETKNAEAGRTANSWSTLRLILFKHRPF
jgi:predicted metallo-beta-lactamase superfamily hydrolase